jgi:hypothetical protein
MTIIKLRGDSNRHGCLLEPVPDRDQGFSAIVLSSGNEHSLSDVLQDRQGRDHVVTSVSGSSMLRTQLLRSGRVKNLPLSEAG